MSLPKTMNDILITFSLLAFTVTGIDGQDFIDTMYFDQDWQQSQPDKASYYRIIRTSPDGNFLFRVEDYYLSGQIQMTGTYRSIRPDYKTGLFTYWYEKGNKQAECEYENNELNGYYNEWYENGHQKSSQYFKKGQLNGTYQSWNNDGTPKLNIQYIEGKKHGYFISYYANGKPVRKDLYENDEFIEGKCFNEDEEPIPYFPYIIMPAFTGGMSALQDYIKEKIQYPKNALRAGIQAIVLTQFTVDEKGNVTGAEVIRGDREEFNAEALRLINSFPPWIPGRIDDHPAPIQVTLPIEFRLD